MTTPAAACDELSFHVDDAGSLAVATCVNTACRIVVLLASSRTWLHPAGGVMVGVPRAAIAITSTSPALAADGAAMVRLVAVVFAAVLAPWKTIPAAGGGGGGGGGGVVVASPRAEISVTELNVVPVAAWPRRRTYRAVASGMSYVSGCTVVALVTALVRVVQVVPSVDVCRSKRAAPVSRR